MLELIVIIIGYIAIGMVITLLVEYNGRYIADDDLVLLWFFWPMLFLVAGIKGLILILKRIYNRIRP
jgi:hypothetical protein